MENFNQPNSQEKKKSGETLSEKQVLDKIREFLDDSEKLEIERKLEDDEGIYLLEVKVEKDDSDETSLYVYTRECDHGNIQESVTRLHVTYFDEDDFPIHADTLSKYDKEKSTWINQ